MNRRLILSLLGACTILSSAGLAADSPELTEKDRLQFTPVSAGIRRASSLTLNEGLPHQIWEAAQLKTELATKKTIQLHDFLFYERPLPIPAAEVEPLRRLSTAADSYSSFLPYQLPKKCGGFHPDYCLAWRDGEATYHLLICFGCHEMRLHGPKQELLVDIRGDAFKEFETILKKYREQRPKRE